MLHGRLISCLCALLLQLLMLLSLIESGETSHDAKRLYDDLLEKGKYNKLPRPAKTFNDSVLVFVDIKLSQIIDVDEKNEIFTTNMWLYHKWKDHNLKWNPDEYGGVSLLYVPSTKIWLPDIVLYNNADGDYAITLFTKATINHDGWVIWTPPVIFKSYCNIDVQYFPFDQQTCHFKFGSWTYGGKVDLRHIAIQPNENETRLIEKAWNFETYYESVEWDIIEAPAKKNIKYYPCCPDEPYPDVTFNLTIRRKTLYYTINLIIPCVCINMLTLLAFYLPSECGEKISVCISILLSLSLFQLLLMDLVPATSLKLPLMGKYLLFTNVLVTLSVFFSVVILNVNFRSNSTHKLPEWMRWTFLHMFPKLLLMKRPQQDFLVPLKTSDWDSPGERHHSDLANYVNPYSQKFQPKHVQNDTSDLIRSTFIGVSNMKIDLAGICEACSRRKQYPPNAQKALEGMDFIAKHSKEDDDTRRIKEEWKYLALVIDRFLLWIYIAVCFICGIGILINAPALYNNSESVTATKETVTEESAPLR